MHVLLGEDNADHGRLLELILCSGDNGSSVTTVPTGAAFLSRLQLSRYDVGLLDYHLPDYDAAELLPLADGVPHCPPIIVISSNDANDTILASLRGGGRDFIPKTEAFDAARLLGSIREVLKRKQSERRLIERQKDECLAVLAGGIAHDFNNMLVGIMGKAALLRNLVPPDGREAEHCESIQRTAQRLADLSRQLLAYARGGKYQPKAVNLNDAVRDTLAILKGTLRSSISITPSLHPELWPVEADFSQLVQALLNICLNACESMGSRGSLSVFTENAIQSAEWLCVRNEPHPPGEYVHVVVVDMGCGIPPEIRQRIFEPYFSMKGQSRGLGLAAVTGIVQNHGGAITLASEPGRGTAFHVHLPRYRGAVARALPERERGGLGVARRARSILLVEDEPEVSDVATEILTARGHAVHHAARGVDALARLRNRPASFDVLVLDMQLPDCSGADVYRACRKSCPEVRVVVCSGYDRDAALGSLLSADHQILFLPKPFTPDQLIRAVEGVAEHHSARRA